MNWSARRGVLNLELVHHEKMIGGQFPGIELSPCVKSLKLAGMLTGPMTI